MKKIIILSIIIAFSLTGCVSPDNEEIKPMPVEERTDELFQYFYNIIKHPISLEDFKKKVKEEKNIIVEEKDVTAKDDESYVLYTRVFFNVTDENSIFKHYRVDVSKSRVLVNFDKPTKNDYKQGYVNKLTFVPVDEHGQPIRVEKDYKKYFDFITKQMKEINDTYEVIYYSENTSVGSAVGGYKVYPENYSAFIEEIKNPDKEIDATITWTKNQNPTLENSSNEKNIPVVKMKYLWLQNKKGSLEDLDSIYKIEIEVNNPTDVYKLFFR